MKAKERSYQGRQTLWGKSHRGLVLNVHTDPHSPTLQLVQGNCIQKHMVLASFLASVLKYQQIIQEKGGSFWLKAPESDGLHRGREDTATEDVVGLSYYISMPRSREAT